LTSSSGVSEDSIPSVTDSKKWLAILDVGHGNSAVLVDEEGIIVIDAGPGSTLLEFLTDKNIHHVDVALISHADRDHIEGLLGLLASDLISFGKIRMNSDALKNSDLWDDLLYELQSQHRKGEIDFDTSLNEAHTGQFNQGRVHIEVLAPSLYMAGKGHGGTDRVGRSLTANSMSTVIRLMKDDRPIALLPGDIDYVGLLNLAEDCNHRGTPDAAKAPILVFPHHGGNPGSGANRIDFARSICEFVEPNTVIFSISRGNRHTPHADIVAFIQQFGSITRIACTELSQQCAANTPNGEPNHLTRYFARGRDTNKCCAGTIVIDLDQPNPLVLPTADAHQDFITISAPTALCRRL
jgi:beta-lactamase superfamily II metal-dependent hydrolase